MFKVNINFVARFSPITLFSNELKSFYKLTLFLMHHLHMKRFFLVKIGLGPSSHGLGIALKFSANSKLE